MSSNKNIIYRKRKMFFASKSLRKYISMIMQNKSVFKSQKLFYLKKVSIPNKVDFFQLVRINNCDMGEMS